MESVESPPSISSRPPGAFLAHDGVPVGFIAVSVMLGTYVLLDVAPSVPLLVLAFCGTALTYQLDRCLRFSPEDRHNRPGHRLWMRAHRGYVWGTAGLLVVAGGVSLRFLRPVTVGFGMIVGVLGVLYAVPVLGPGRRLKSFWRLKPLVIGGGWALGGVLLPVLEAGETVAVGGAALAGYRFAIVLANVLLADFGDRMGDAQVALRTVATEWTPPVLLGTVRCLLGAIVLAGLAVSLAYRLPLLFVDLAGPVLMFVLTRRIEVRLTRAQRLAVDALVAWPLVTALAAWLGGIA